MMLNIFLIELKKIFLQKKTYVVWIVFILMLLLNTNANMIDKEHNILNSLNNASNIKNITQKLQRINDVLLDKNTTETEKKQYETYLKNVNIQLSSFNIIQDRNADNSLKLKAKIDIIKSNILEISQGKLVTAYSIIDYNKELRFLNYLYENKIPEYTSSHNSFKFIFNFLSGLFPILFMLLITLLASDIVTKEIEESTIKLILVQPISRIKILTGKYLALMSCVITMILSTFLTSFIIIWVKDGIGNPSYPFISNMKYSFDEVNHTYNYIEGSGIYISSLELLVKSILLFLLISIVVASISFMISVLSNTSTMSMSIGIIVNIGLIYMVFGTKILEKFNQYIYISYYNVYDVISGRITETLNNNQISMFLGIIQMLFIMIATYVVSCIVFKNKDI